MNRFDKSLENQLGGWLSDRWRDIKEAVKDPVTLINPTVALYKTQAQAGTQAAQKVVSEVERSKIAQGALAILVNPALAFTAAQAEVARQNPAEALAVAAVAASLATAGTSMAAVGNIGAGALASGSAAIAGGMTSEQAAKQAAASGLNAAGNIALDLLGNSGLDLSALDPFISPEKLQSEINRLIAKGTITPDQAQTITRTIAQLRAEGKSDNEIIGELVNSQFFAQLTTRELETLTHPVLFREFYNFLINRGYDHDTSTRVAMQAATRYAAEFAAMSVQRLKARAPGNLDPKLFLALIPIAAYFLIK